VNWRLMRYIWSSYIDTRLKNLSQYFSLPFTHPLFILKVLLFLKASLRLHFLPVVVFLSLRDD